MKYSCKLLLIIVPMLAVLGCANGQIKEQLAKQQERIERIEQEKKMTEAYNEALLAPELYRAYHLLVFAARRYDDINININKEYAMRAINKALEFLNTEKKCSYNEFTQYKNMVLTMFPSHKDPEPTDNILTTTSTKECDDGKSYTLKDAKIIKSASPDFEILTIRESITSRGKSNSKFLSVLRVDNKYYIRDHDSFEDMTSNNKKSGDLK